MSHPPDPLSSVAPWVPEALAEVVHQAIEHDLTKRIPSCMELARRLVQVRPIRGGRGMPLSAADMADTWADPASVSPYAAQDTPREDPPSVDEPAPVSRSVVREHPSDDSLTIDVEVGEPTGAQPAVAARAASGTRSPLVSSGIRAPGEEGSAEGAEDAPQFFDRKSLETMGSPASGPRSVDLPVDSRQAVTARTQKKDLLAHAAASALASAEPRRISLGWMALAFIALGLAVVVALAFR